MTNEQMAHYLEAVADLLEAQQANPFRIQAYRAAAVTLHNMNEPAAAITSQYGPLRGKRIVRGHEDACRQYYEQLSQLKTDKQLAFL